MKKADEGEIERRILCPSIAICLVDDFTGGPPKGWIDVIIRGQENKKAVNSCGNCFFFFDLPSQPEYAVQVRSENYFDLALTLKPLGPEELPTVYFLIPLPSYPFPQGETLVRGILWQSEKNPICNSEISSTAETLSFKGKTDSSGEFSVYFKSLKSENLSKDGIFIVSSEENNVLPFKLDYPDREGLPKGPKSGFFKNIKAGITNSKRNGAIIELDDIKGGF